MIAYVICLNDWPRLVVLDDEDKAKEKMAEMREERLKEYDYNKTIELMSHWNIREVEYI